MHRSQIALSIALIAVAAFAAPARRPSSRPDDSAQVSQLAGQLTSLEKALPEAQKKHDRDFYNRTLTDDFISIGTDGKVHPKSEIMSSVVIAFLRRSAGPSRSPSFPKHPAIRALRCRPPRSPKDHWEPNKPAP